MTDFDTSDCEERLVDIGAAFVADAQPAVLMQPAVRALNDPAVDPQAAAVVGAAARQHRFDAACPQLAAVGLGVVRPIALDPPGPAARPPGLAPHRRDRVHQFDQLRDIVAVGGRDLCRQRRAMGVGEDVVLRAVFPAIRGARAGVRPPKTARTEALSTTARDQSILSAPRSLSSKTRWMRFQTPRLCQSRSRRQQVIPEPYPSSRGSISQGMPLRSTNRMPDSTSRLSSGLRPGYRRRPRLGLGNNGSMTVHKPSSKIGLAMAGPPCPTAISLGRDWSFC
jgi:hypothetical protein